MMILGKYKFFTPDLYEKIGVKGDKECYEGLHDGIFHADDVFAYAITRLYYAELDKLVRVLPIRTRNKEQLEKCDIICDVGNKYDGVRYFDHHQEKIPMVEGSQVSHCGFSMLAKAMLKPELFEAIRENILVPIALQDNGETYEMVEDSIHKFPSIGSFVQAFNLNMAEQEGMNEEMKAEIALENFEAAADIAQEVLGRMLWAACESIEFEAKIREVGNKSNEIAVFDSFMPGWKKIISQEYPTVMFGVFPHDTAEGRRWDIVSTTGKSPLDNKCLFPEKWRAKNDAELSEISDIPGGVFVHKNGFMGAWDNRESAIEAARKAVLLHGLLEIF